MKRTSAYILIAGSIVLLGIDFWFSGLDFSLGRIVRNSSNVLLIILGLMFLKNSEKKEKE